MFLMTLAFSFAQYTQSVYTAYATSAFKTHSQLAVAGVVSRVFSIMAYCVVSDARLDTEATADVLRSPKLPTT